MACCLNGVTIKFHSFIHIIFLPAAQVQT